MGVLDNFRTPCIPQNLSLLALGIAARRTRERCLMCSGASLETILKTELERRSPRFLVYYVFIIIIFPYSSLKLIVGLIKISFFFFISLSKLRRRFSLYQHGGVLGCRCPHEKTTYIINKSKYNIFL
jgi:hypothetical protein